MTCKWLIKPITNPNGVSSTQTRYIIIDYVIVFICMETFFIEAREQLD
jgi:hypothetical protein